MKLQTLFLWMTASSQLGNGFQTRSIPTKKKSSIRITTPSLRVTTLEDEDRVIDVTVTSEEEKDLGPVMRSKEESPRLIKAKQLLKQFTFEKEQEASSSSSSSSSSGGSSGSSSRRPLSNATPTAATTKVPLGVVSIKNSYKGKEEEASSSDSIVRDQYWSNGHLQGGNYVTRWARGVMVAEPLIKYDPEAAEKLLFRQPRKWLVRNTQIAFPIGLWAAGVATDFLIGRSKENRRNRARQLLHAITNLGPAIIKGGTFVHCF